MEQFFRIGVSVKGVKKRCRKSELHYLSGGKIPYNDGNFDQVEVENLAKKLLFDMKTTEGKIMVILNHIKVSDGFETWEMFGKTNVEFELTSSLEKELQ